MTYSLMRGNPLHSMPLAISINRCKLIYTSDLPRFAHQKH